MTNWASGFGSLVGDSLSDCMSLIGVPSGDARFNDPGHLFNNFIRPFYKMK
jgi:hypothetical protein